MRSLVGIAAPSTSTSTLRCPARVTSLTDKLNNAGLPFTDPLLLRRFYQCMYGDVEETKKLIEVNYSLRNRHPHLFIKRDPLDDDSQRTFDYADILPLPGLTPDGYKVSLYCFREFEATKMHHTEDTRAFFMVADCRFITPDDSARPGILSEGEVQIFDMKGTTMRHISRLTISTLRAYIKFLQLAFPVRLRAIHMVNCPSYLDRIVSVVKPFISDEVFKLIRFHTVSMESLYAFVPREMLPEEYGGSAGSLDTLRTQTKQALVEHRDYLMNPNHWLVEKSEKRNGHSWRIFR
ncbi:alpha-tocopherol transfer protein-like isoform X1 [Drosophila obscura]|uniref:alpha-tocopherol transfer protein-like isoform X1 n=1 Tax=Drosophila obscura TaxID=7282 RepID=UPI000BA12917|nr:alpha-tocopherol transfer protein-like isoform X1 [Drosophila obscura]